MRQLSHGPWTSRSLWLCTLIGIIHHLQVYSGGIGSYALLVMVAAFLLLHPSRADANGDGAAQLEGNLGVLLLDFLRLYGRSLNVGDVGVSCRCFLGLILIHIICATSTVS